MAEVGGAKPTKLVLGQSSLSLEQLRKTVLFTRGVEQHPALRLEGSLHATLIKYLGPGDR